MLPRTHEAIIRLAVSRGGSTWTLADLPSLIRGHRDEDDFVFLGLRLRAPGLTHTYRPGHRFGELFAPNARTQMLRCVRKATGRAALRALLERRGATDPPRTASVQVDAPLHDEPLPASKPRTATHDEPGTSSSSKARSAARVSWWMGRACHLLADIAVPARAHGVWHFYGDPFETWLEEEPGRVDAICRGRIDVPEASPGDIADIVASLAARYPADTTRTPWGQFLYGRTGKSVRLYEKDVEAQARKILPVVVGCTAALLRAVPSG